MEMTKEQMAQAAAKVSQTAAEVSAAAAKVAAIVFCFFNIEE